MLLELDGKEVVVDPLVVKAIQGSKRKERYQLRKKISVQESSLDAIGYSPKYLSCQPYAQLNPVEDAIMSAFDRGMIMAAMARLPTKESQVIRLLYFKGLSVTDAAREIGCKRETVRNRERRAIRRLKEILAEV